MAAISDSDFDDIDMTDDNSTSPAPDYHKHKRARGNRKKLWLGLLIIVVLIGLGLGGMKFAKRTKPITQTQQSVQNKALPDVATDVPDVSTSKTYDSQNMNLTLSYPSNWTLTASADSSVRIVSPAFSYKNIASEEIKGNFRVYIRQTARPIDTKYIGLGMAAEPSHPLTYAKPTASQRKTTYLTNFGFDTPDNFAFFFIAGNFNLDKGDTLGPNYGTEPGTNIISGGYSSDSLRDDMATHQVPLDYFAKTKAYKQALKIVESLQIR